MGLKKRFSKMNGKVLDGVGIMEKKEKYKEFCRQTYVPIYSKPWWMDAVCQKENWNVWLYEKGQDILAAMPYYLKTMGGGINI